MKTIKSFTVDHLKLDKGLYTSRVDGEDIVTYDIRMKKPYKDEVLNTAAIHAMEHLGATYVRNSKYTDNIIYFGPMGCRTGFYIVVKGLESEKVIGLLQDTFKFISEYQGEIPGATEIECGNCYDMNLEGAKKEATEYYEVLKNITVEKLVY